MKYNYYCKLRMPGRGGGRGAMGPPCLKFGQPFQHLPHSLLKASLVLYVLRIFVLQNSNIFHMYGGPLFRQVFPNFPQNFRQTVCAISSGRPIDLLGKTDF